MHALAQLKSIFFRHCWKVNWSHLNKLDYKIGCVVCVRSVRNRTIGRWVANKWTEQKRCWKYTDDMIRLSSLNECGWNLSLRSELETCQTFDHQSIRLCCGMLLIQMLCAGIRNIYLNVLKYSEHPLFVHRFEFKVNSKLSVRFSHSHWSQRLIETDAPTIFAATINEFALNNSSSKSYFRS